MAGIIDGFRWSLLAGASQLHWPSTLISLSVVVFLLVSGVRYFRKTERTFADVI
jgi:lipopolysaccharide transport system permease protein